MQKPHVVPQISEAPLSLSLQRTEPSLTRLHNELQQMLDHWEWHKHLGPQIGSEDIHQLRVALKRVRALLSLFRDHLPKVKRLRHEERLKQLSDQLAMQRDFDSTREVLLHLLHGSVKKPVRRGYEIIFERLATEQEPQVEWLPVCLATARAALRSVRLLLELVSADPASLQTALGRTYRKGREQFKRCKQDRTTPQFHLLRRWDKRLLYQLEFFASDDSLDARQGLQRLGGILGSVQDIALLLKVAKRKVRAESALAQVKPALRDMRRQKEKLQLEALQLGQEIFSKRPRKFLRQLEAGAT